VSLDFSLVLSPDGPTSSGWHRAGVLELLGESSSALPTAVPFEPMMSRLALPSLCGSIVVTFVSLQQWLSARFACCDTTAHLLVATRSASNFLGLFRRCQA
jgi:hypothetical protein